MKKLSVIFLTLILLVSIVPITTTAATTSYDDLLQSPNLQPGDLLWAGAADIPNGGIAYAFYRYEYNFAEIMFRNVKDWAAQGLVTTQFDPIIQGDCVEFAGPPVITYDNGTVIYGVIDKYTDGVLNREQAATTLSRLANVLGKPLLIHAAAFADNDSISSWAIQGAGQVQAAGIMTGVGNNTFAPKSPYTREQSIITILRLLNNVSA